MNCSAKRVCYNKETSNQPNFLLFVLYKKKNYSVEETSHCLLSEILYSIEVPLFVVSCIVFDKILSCQCTVIMNAYRVKFEYGRYTIRDCRRKIIYSDQDYPINYKLTYIL